MSTFRGAKNGGNYGSNLSQPIRIACNWTVDSTNGNGLGIRSLKSNGWIRNVFMHTSATPGTNNGVTNPNPPVGYALVQFKQNFNIYLGGSVGFVSQLSGSSISVTSGLTQYAPYVITSVGTTTTAQWQALGLPAGLTPTVGQSFIAATATAGSGTGTVQAPATGGSGITVSDVIGDPNQSISNSSIATNGGAYVLVRFLAPTSSSVTTLVATAPANNSVVGAFFEFDQSSADPIMLNGDPANS
jgi:hypothetical protein